MPLVERQQPRRLVAVREHDERAVGEAESEVGVASVDVGNRRVVLTLETRDGEAACPSTTGTTSAPEGVAPSFTLPGTIWSRLTSVPARLPVNVISNVVPGALLLTVKFWIPVVGS